MCRCIYIYRYIYYIRYIVNACRFCNFKIKFQPNNLPSYIIILVMKKDKYTTLDRLKLADINLNKKFNLINVSMINI